MKRTILKILSIMLLYFVIIFAIILLEEINPLMQKIFVLFLALGGAWTLKVLSANVNNLPWLASKSKREKRLVNVLIYIMIFVVTAGVLLHIIKNYF